MCRYWLGRGRVMNPPVALTDGENMSSIVRSNKWHVNGHGANHVSVAEYIFLVVKYN